MINVEDWKELAWKHANKSYNDKIQGIELEDLYQCAMLGMYIAAQNYDESKGAFSTYAHYHITNEINKAQYEQVNRQGVHKRVNKVKEELYTDIPEQGQVDIEECEQLAYEFDAVDTLWTDAFINTVPLEGVEKDYLINMMVSGDKEATKMYMEITGHTRQRASQVKMKVRETAQRHARRLE